MTDHAPGEITRILAGAAGLSREEALERLVPLVYDELRVIARSRLRSERPDHTFQTTDLVHEAWMKLAGDHNPPWNDRVHFFRAAAEAMRRILIDHARTQRGCWPRTSKAETCSSRRRSRVRRRRPRWCSIGSASPGDSAPAPAATLGR